MTTMLTKESLLKIIESADEVLTALAGTNEDVHPDDGVKMCGLWDELNDRYAPPAVVREMARMLLAGMSQLPIAWLNDAYLARGVVDGEAGSEDAGPGYIPAYREPVPQPLTGAERAELEQYRKAAWEIIQQHCGSDFVLPHDLVSALRELAVPQPAPVADADLLHTAASAIEDLLTNKDRTGEAVWYDVPARLRRAAMLQAGNSPVIQDGYVLVPKEPTLGMIHAWLSEVANFRGHAAGYRAALAAAPQQEQTSTASNVENS